MGWVRAHCLDTGKAHVLPSHSKCIDADPLLELWEVANKLPGDAIDPSAIRLLASCRSGTIVYVEWGDPAAGWLKLRVA